MTAPDKSPNINYQTCIRVSPDEIAKLKAKLYANRESIAGFLASAIRAAI
jgi:hypothetical protein